MKLSWHEARLTRRLDEAELHLASLLQRAHIPLSGKRDLFELEGWLSDVWQVWCRFCRGTVFASCGGCLTATGNTLAATHASPEIVSFIASRQSNGIPPTAVGTNTRLVKEPTWGHIDKLLDVIQALNPTNRATLLSAFGTVPLIEHIRLIRNAAAHRNTQTMADVLALQPMYQATPIRHPLEALLWVDTNTGRALMHSRLDEMRIAAKNACI